mgnify:FL=1
MLYSVIGITTESAEVTPLYCTTSESNARQMFNSVSLDKQARGFDEVKLLAEIETN